jgi:hypothetical protein
MVGGDLSSALDDLTSAIVLLALIELRTYLARRGVGPRRAADQEETH